MDGDKREARTPVQAGDLPAAETWLIDGYNLLHAGLLTPDERAGPWWSGPLRTRVIERVGEIALRLPAARGVTIVFDGPDPGQETPTSDGALVRVIFAPSADDWLLGQVRNLVKAREAPASQPPADDSIDEQGVVLGIVVVTADRRLASRLSRRGAHVILPLVFLTPT